MEHSYGIFFLSRLVFFRFASPFSVTRIRNLGFLVVTFGQFWANDKSLFIKNAIKPSSVQLSV